MVFPLIGVVLGALSLVGIAVDWYYSIELENASSQLIELLNAIQYGTTFNDFVSNCWLFIILGFVLVWIVLSLAFPKRRRSY